MTRTIYIVEDHPGVRETLHEFIETVEGFSVCGSAGSGEEAVEDRAVLEADIVLVDMSLPGMTGTELIRLLLEKAPSLRCLMLSAHSEAYYARQALSAGACGYVAKQGPRELVDAILQVAEDGIYRGREPGGRE